MKLNWGTAIVIAFIGFIGFIMFFVVRMSTDDKYNHELVADDYYQQELEYQNDIDKVENAKALSEEISYKKTEEGLLLSFPKEIDQLKIEGKVFLIRPSNKQLDFEMPISLSNHYLLIPDNRLLDGRWNIRIEWTEGKETYLYKSALTY
ncbi:FixH family protein [Winogradskyella aurantiaca]|uniref:FixH family protein n=1 Tax=Winogradskyella aurantiaca TaxID=2219558 RepID=UPI000E1D9A11|nr:FixH family protein [Winogradskyella aurantiaca]